MIVEVEEAHRGAINVTMRIHDAYALCEPIDTINNLKNGRRIWDEIEVMENDNLGIDDAHGDDQKGHIAEGNIRRVFGGNVCDGRGIRCRCQGNECWSDS